MTESRYISATRLRHRGNHRYALRFGRNARHRSQVRIGLASGAYPKGAVDSPVDGEQLYLFDPARA